MIFPIGIGLVEVLPAAGPGLAAREARELLLEVRLPTLLVSDSLSVATGVPERAGE